MEFFSFNWHSDDYIIESKNKEEQGEVDKVNKYDKFNDWKKKKEKKGHRIEIYCLNRASEPCLIRVEDYKPYCYIQLPKNVKWNTQRLNEIITILRANYLPGVCKGIETVKLPGLFGYLQGSSYYLFCRFNNLDDMRAAKQKIEGNDVIFGPYELELEVCEVDVEVVRKFTIERKLQMADWFTCQGEEIIEEDQKISTFTHEYIVKWDSLNPIDPKLTTGWKLHPRLLAFDIECNSEDGIRFPNEFKYKCQCFAISLNYQQVGLPETKKKYSLILGDCTEPKDCIPYYCDDEVELIETFVKLMNELNADILSGYNIFGFDFKYLNGRLSLMWEDWLQAGSRIKGRLPTFIDESWTSSNTNKVNLEYIDFPGRISADVYGIVKTRDRLPNYKLENISKKYLEGKTKHDVTPAQLFASYNKFLETRDMLEKCTKRIDENGKPWRHENVTKKAWRRLIHEYLEAMKNFAVIIEYCNQDSELVVLLFEKLNLWETMIQFANVLQVRIKQVYTKGQQYKGFSQLYALLKQKNVIFNGCETEVRKEKYEGALNLGTKYKKVGMFHNVISGDVNSMYPSIILANNLCVSTEITKEEAEKYGKDQYRHFEWIDCPGTDREYPYDLRFVTDKIHEGFIPQLVKKLLAERKLAKDLMNQQPPKSVEYSKYNSKQEALKVSANSIYGMLGTSKNPRVPSKHIAALVTKIGRDTLMKIVGFVKYGGDPGYDEQGNPTKTPIFPTGDVIYGDSVTRDTPVLIKRRNNEILYVNIEDIPRRTKWIKKGTKMVADPEDGLEIWSDKGFTELKKIIKHRTDKHIYRIATHTGSVDVTADHSLLTPDGKEIRPVDVYIGDDLMHNDLPIIQDPHLDKASVFYNCPYSLGLFYGAEECGADGCDAYQSGTKHSLAINSINLDNLNKAKTELGTHYKDYTFKILDTRQIDGVYKLVPCEELKELAVNWQKFFYNRRKQKIIPAELISAPIEIVDLFMKGYHDANGDKESPGDRGIWGEENMDNKGAGNKQYTDNRGAGDQEYIGFDNKGAIASAGLLYLAYRLGYDTGINCSKDKLDVYGITLSKSKQKKSPISIKQKWDLGKCESYVYDLETANHHFAAGVGKLVVHNTDSCQFIINREFKDNFELIEFGEAYIEQINKYVAPLRLAFEKCGDMMLIGPKKYIFRMIDCSKIKLDKTPNERFGHWIKDYKYTGVEVVKRNQAEITRRLYKTACEHIMNDGYRLDVEKDQREVLRLQDVVDMVFFDVAMTLYEIFDLKDFLISEAYNKESKTSSMSILVGRMSRRGKPINLGERVSYVYCQYPGERKDGKVGMKMRLPDDFDENERLDTLYYVKKMMTPIDGLLCARYKGSKIYERFMAEKQVVKKLGAILLEKNLIDRIPKNPDKAYMTIIENKFNSGNSAGALELPRNFTDLVLFRDSEEYAQVPRGVKMALSRSINYGHTFGYTLLMNTPSLVENIILADNELGIFEEYARIMMSEKKFEEMIRKITK